jgi:hypothetical protein
MWATCDILRGCSFFVEENQKHILFLFFLCRRRFHVVVVVLRSQGLAAQAVEGSLCPKALTAETNHRIQSRSDKGKTLYSKRNNVLIIYSHPPVWVAGTFREPSAKNHSAACC